MNSAEQFSNRIIELEIKLSYAEVQIEALNHTIYLQQQQINSLQRDVLAIRHHLTTNAGDEPVSLQDDLPPHY